MSKWDKQNETNRRWRQRNRPKFAAMMRSVHYRRRYSATIADYGFHYTLQDGKCACCGRANNNREGSKYFDMDHDHSTGELRGLLCNACNRLVGRAENLWSLSENNLKKVEKYLTGRMLIDII